MTGWLEWGYWAVFFLMILENVVPPVPSEAIMSTAGIMVAQGKLDFVLLVIVGTVGTVIGNLFWYEIGRRLGYERLKPAVDRWGRWVTLEWEDVEKIHRYFDRWGGPTIFFFRFMPFGRTVISIPAGLMRMPFWKFVAYTTAGSAIWNSFLVGIGFWLGATFAEIEHYIAPLVIATIVLGAAAYLWRILTWKPRAKRG